MELNKSISFEHFTHSEFLQLSRDYSETAKTARLRYVSDSLPGIRRVRKGSGYAYYRDDNVRIKDKEELERIKALAIPPAWVKVWICAYRNGHIQATGYDLRNRKQYRYHTLWNVVRNETKFHRLYEFGKALPQLRKSIEQDLIRKDLSQERVIATVISLMERTYIRIGNDGYEKLYGLYGLTTLKDRHVKIDGKALHFTFVGKKGITQSITLKNARLAKLVKQCRDIPGKELFQYYNDAGERCPIDSGMVNDYIKKSTGDDFTAKDIRTWAGSLNLIRSLRAIGSAISETECKKNILMALDEVSRKLGNTRTVCRKYYVHPGLIRLYEENNLSRYLKELDGIEEPDLKTDLTSDEKIVMRILKTLN